MIATTYFTSEGVTTELAALTLQSNGRQRTMYFCGWKRMFEYIAQLGDAVESIIYGGAVAPEYMDWIKA